MEALAQFDTQTNTARSDLKMLKESATVLDGDYEELLARRERTRQLIDIAKQTIELIENRVMEMMDADGEAKLETPSFEVKKHLKSSEKWNLELMQKMVANKAVDAASLLACLGGGVYFKKTALRAHPDLPGDALINTCVDTWYYTGQQDDNGRAIKTQVAAEAVRVLEVRLKK